MNSIKFFLVFTIFASFVVSSTCFAEEDLCSTVSTSTELGYRVQNNTPMQEQSCVDIPTQLPNEVDNSDDSIIVIEEKSYLIHDGKALLLE